MKLKSKISFSRSLASAFGLPIANCILPTVFRLLSVLCLLSSVLCLSPPHVHAASPGLPFTEDFSDKNLMDPQKTNANWSPEEKKIYMAWRKKVYGSLDLGSRSGNINLTADSTRSIALGDLDGDGSATKM